MRLGMGAIPLLGWNRYALHVGMAHSCSIDMTSTSINAASYTYSMLAFCFVLPIATMLYCFLRSLKLRRKQTKVVKRSVSDIGSMNRRVRRERQHNAMAVAMVVVFVVVWSPYASCVLVLSITGRVSDTLMVTSTLFAKTSTLYNPLIYMCVEDFRRKCRKFFKCSSKSAESFDSSSNSDVGIGGCSKSPSTLTSIAMITSNSQIEIKKL